MLSSIKNKLSDYLNKATHDLSDEHLPMLSKIKENGISALIKHVIKSKDFTAISLLNIAYSLNANSDAINNKLKEDNQKIIEEIGRLENDLIYTDILHKFYEPKNARNLKIAMKLSDINTHELDIKSLQDIPFIGFDNGTYINPYNNSAFDIESKTEEGSDINSLIDPNERIITATVRMSLMSQTNWLEDSGKDHSGLIYSCSKEKIAKMGLEFVLFHELAHSAAKKYLLEGKNDESFADICGVIQVIKNNDLSQEDAIKFVNRILLYRSEADSIAYYAINFEDDANQTPNDRYHFTQNALLYLKEVLQTSFTHIKEMPIKEQAIFAANLVVALNFCGVDDTIKDRLCIYDKESTDIYIDEILATEQQHIQDIAHYQGVSSQQVVERIKHNISNDPKKILDINFHVLYKRNEDTIYEIDSFFPLDTKFIIELQNHSTQNHKELDIERNFTHSQLVKELDKKEIKRKPK